MVAIAGESSIRAVLFDFDGVILESASVKTDAFVELFSHLPEHQITEIMRHHLANAGVSRFKKFDWIYRTLLGCALCDEERDELGRRFSEISFQRVLAAPFVPGALAAIRALHRSHLLFVVSGTPQAELDQIVQARGLGGYFREVHGTPREKPEIVRDILAREHLGQRQALFVGDGSSDHLAAQEAGVPFLARATDECLAQWKDAGVRYTPDLTNLVQIVRGWDR
jgi:phosphoglycolate phosphatase-like HAD superfamily hydrolase